MRISSGTVTSVNPPIPSSNSVNPEKIGDRVLDSIRRRSRPVLRYPRASCRYRYPSTKAGKRNSGKTKLDSNYWQRNFNRRWQNSRYGDDSCEESCQGRINSLQRACQCGIYSLNIFSKTIEHATLTHDQRDKML